MNVNKRSQIFVVFEYQNGGNRKAARKIVQ